MSSDHANEAESGAGFAPSRRRWLAGMAGASLSAGLLASAGASAESAAAGTAAPAAAGAAAAGGLDGSRADFELAQTYLDNASMHPISRATGAALRHYMDARLMNARGESVDMSGSRERAMALFGALFHADQDELAWLPSTMVGENVVVRGLGLPGTRQRVVTDEYHFNGSLYMYGELAKLGLDVHIVRARDHRIHLDDLAQAITPGTRLVSLTLISNVAGFEHDLKAVCELAHARGAMVYADIIQAAGNTPIDLHASGVDFAASSTYKWLMGDFGVGVFYARRQSQAKLQRTQWGFRQEGRTVTHYLPFDAPSDPPSAAVLESAPRSDLAGLVEVGTLGNGAAVALAESLAYLQKLGIERIAQWRQPLLARLQEAVPRLGYLPMTPPDSRSPIVSFAREGVHATLAPKLAAAGVGVSVYRNYFRVALSFYNTLDDVERLIEVLS